MTSTGAVSHMALALAEARAAAARGEVPVGAVVVSPHGRGACGGGKPDVGASRSDGARRNAGDPRRLRGRRLGTAYRLRSLCHAGALPDVRGGDFFARLRRLYYGASDPKGGGIEQGARVFSQPTCHHVPEIIPVSRR